MAGILPGHAEAEEGAGPLRLSAVHEEIERVYLQLCHEQLLRAVILAHAMEPLPRTIGQNVQHIRRVVNTALEKQGKKQDTRQLRQFLAQFTSHKSTCPVHPCNCGYEAAIFQLLGTKPRRRPKKIAEPTSPGVELAGD